MPPTFPSLASKSSAWGTRIGTLVCRDELKVVIRNSSATAGWHQSPWEEVNSFVLPPLPIQKPNEPLSFWPLAAPCEQGNDSRPWVGQTYLCLAETFRDGHCGIMVDGTGLYMFINTVPFQNTEQYCTTYYKNGWSNQQNAVRALLFT